MKVKLEDAAGRVAALAGEHEGLYGLCRAIGLDPEEVEGFCAHWFGEAQREDGKPSPAAAVTLFMLGVQVGRDLD